MNSTVLRPERAGPRELAAVEQHRAEPQVIGGRAAGPPPPDWSAGLDGTGKRTVFGGPSGRCQGSAARLHLRRGTQNAVSVIPSGRKMRSSKKGPSVLPETTSTSRPSTSVDPPYSQRVPGWYSSGRRPSFATSSALVSSGFPLCVAIGAVHRRLAASAVGEARGVPQEVLHRDLAGRVRHPASSGRRRSSPPRPFASPAPAVARHRVGDLQPALLHEHHRRDPGDRLGHRGEAKDRVLGHRRAGGRDRAKPQGLGVRRSSPGARPGSPRPARGRSRCVPG